MRDRLRVAAEAIAAVVIWPIVAGYRFGLAGYDTTGTWLSMIPGHLGMFLRRAWYARTLARCGSGLSVQFQAVISDPASHIGNDCFVGHFTRIGLVSIGDDVLIGEHSSIIAGGQQYGFVRRDIPMRMQPGVHSRVTIGDDVWVGAMSLVSSDVAAHSIVGGGSVVNRRYDEWEILAGVPAAPVGTRPPVSRPWSPTAA